MTTPLEHELLEALKALRPFGMCWCGVISNPMNTSLHSLPCQMATRAVANATYRELHSGLSVGDTENA